jgi:tetratricopeptide (TPR) repeat protein
VSDGELEPGGAAGPDPLAQILARARHWIDVERYADAQRELARGLELAPEDPWLHFELGRSLLLGQQARRARACFEQCLRCDPEFAPALALLAMSRMELGDYPRAEQDLLEALRIAPDFALAYESYGDLMRVTGHAEKAKALYTRGLALDPEQGSLHSKIALLENERWSGEHSRGFVRQGLELAPDDALGHVSMAHHLLNRGRPFAARKHVREALRIEPGNASIEEFWLEIDRCTRLVYLPMFYWSMLLARVPGQQFALWGAMMLFAFGAPKLGMPQAVAGAIFLSYGGFCLYTWFAGALVNGWIRVFPPRL